MANTSNYDEQGGAVTNIGGVINVLSGGTIDVESGGSIDVASGGSIAVASGGSIDVADGGDVNVADGGSVDLADGGLLNFGTGSDITLTFDGTNLVITGLPTSDPSSAGALYIDGSSQAITVSAGA